LPAAPAPGGARPAPRAPSGLPAARPPRTTGPR
jgi:hypothetical protein